MCNKIGKTPSAVSIEIGLSKSAVHRWKNGGFPTDATAAKVASYFNMSVASMMGLEEEKKNDITFDDFTYAMYNETKDLTDEDKEALLSMARILKKKNKH